MVVRPLFIPELCGTALLAGGIFPTAFFANLLWNDGAGALLPLLLFPLPVFGVGFPFLAGEKFLAFGLCAAA